MFCSYFHHVLRYYVVHCLEPGETFLNIVKTFKTIRYYSILVSVIISIYFLKFRSVRMYSSYSLSCPGQSFFYKSTKLGASCDQINRFKIHPTVVKLRVNVLNTHSCMTFKNASSLCHYNMSIFSYNEIHLHLPYRLL